MSPLLLDVLHDLRARKMLPVAALLGVAMILTPVFLLDSAADQVVAPTPLPEVEGTAQVAGVPPLALEDAAAQPSSFLTAFGRKNPFERPLAEMTAAEVGEVLTTLGGGDTIAGTESPGTEIGSGVGTTLSGGGGDPFGGAPGGSPPGSPGNAPPDPTDPVPPADGGSPAPPYTPPAAAPTDPTSPSNENGEDEDDAKDEDEDKSKDEDSSSSSDDRDRLDIYADVVDLRVKEDGDTRTIEDVYQPTPLPREERQLALFLGVTEEQEAIFLISSTVDDVDTDDGRCTPSPSECSMLYLDEGESARLTDDETGGPVVITVTDISFEKVEERSSSSLRHRADRRSQAADARAERRERRLLRQRREHGGPQPFLLPRLVRFFVAP